jgi:hypothetical protein
MQFLLNTLLAVPVVCFLRHFLPPPISKVPRPSKAGKGLVPRHEINANPDHVILGSNFMYVCAALFLTITISLY